MLAIICIRGVAAIGNIISIMLNGLMFETIDSGRIIGTGRRSGMATMRCCTVVVVVVVVVIEVIVIVIVVGMEAAVNWLFILFSKCGCFCVSVILFK